MKIDVNDFWDVLVETIEAGKEFVLPINGTSMQPFLHTGDRVVLINADKLKRLDAILYKRSDGHVVFHRIIKCKKDYFLVAGDNQTNLEEVARDQIVAKMQGYVINDKLHSAQSLFYKIKIHIWSFFLFRKIYWKLFGHR